MGADVVDDGLIIAERNAARRRQALVANLVGAVTPILQHFAL